MSENWRWTLRYLTVISKQFIMLLESHFVLQRKHRAPFFLHTFCCM